MRKTFFYPLAISIWSLVFVGALWTLTKSAFAQSGYEMFMANIPNGDLTSPNFTFDLNAITDDGIAGTVKQRWIRGGVNYFFSRIIGLLAGLIGGFSVLMMSYGGFLILSSAGGESQYEKGVEYLKNSAIGLTVVLSSYILVNAVQLLIRSIYA